MKHTKLAIILAGALALVGLVACALTPGQQVTAAGIGAGQAIGAKLLSSHIVNGGVDPAYLASYEAEIPNVAGLMQGKITPADLNKILGTTGVTLSSSQQQVVGLLAGVSSEFIKVNGGTTMSPEGQNVNGAAQQVAVGLGYAVGQETGVNYVPGPSGY